MSLTHLYKSSRHLAATCPWWRKSWLHFLASPVDWHLSLAPCHRRWTVPTRYPVSWRVVKIPKTQFPAPQHQSTRQTPEFASHDQCAPCLETQNTQRYCPETNSFGTSPKRRRNCVGLTMNHYTLTNRCPDLSIWGRRQHPIRHLRRTTATFLASKMTP